MAVENRVFLNGQIRSIRKAKKDDETVQITIGLFVIRRPRAISGNRAGDIRSDVVLIMVRDKDMISYLENKKARIEAEEATSGLRRNRIKVEQVEQEVHKAVNVAQDIGYTLRRIKNMAKGNY